MLPYLIALVCVLGLVAGQILFKLGALALAKTGSLTSVPVLSVLAPAFVLYCGTSLAWVWVLQKIELGRIYPVFALGFALVPVASYFIFGERFSPYYPLGVGLVLLGLLIILRP